MSKTKKVPVRRRAAVWQLIVSCVALVVLLGGCYAALQAATYIADLEDATPHIADGERLLPVAVAMSLQSLGRSRTHWRSQMPDGKW